MLRVVGRADVDRRVVHGVRTLAEDGLELAVVVGREPHVVMPQPGSAAPNGEQEHEAGERRGRLLQVLGRTLGALVVEQVAVHVLGIGVGDDDARLDALAIGERDARDVPVGEVDARHVGAVPHGDAALDASRRERVGQGAEASAEVPCPEGLLHVGDRGEDGGRLARIGPGVGGVPVEHLSQAPVGQVLLAEVAKGRHGRDGADVVGVLRQRQQVAPAGQRGLEEGLARDAPHAPAAVDESPPVVLRAAAEGLRRRRSRPWRGRPPAPSPTTRRRSGSRRRAPRAAGRPPPRARRRS